MDDLRKPLFLVALVLIVLVVLLELGSLGVLGGKNADALAVEDLLPAGETEELFRSLEPDEQEELAARDKPPGMGIPYLVFLDGTVLFTVALVGAGLLLPETIQAKTQGIVTLLFSALLIVTALAFIFVAVAAVSLMVSLLVAAPFGTLIYLAIYGFFNRGGANVALTLLMMLKLGFVACLVLAQQRFLQNKGLVLLILTSLLGNVIVSFLHGFVPGFLVSITDAIAAIVVAALAILWAIFLLIGSLVSVFKAVS
ncbi:MAG: hypothetical protein L0332_21085 [Chloroflexi bacterium]|nr:hypothetical protein [Chloroflexota bacterium]MCI0578454.1 hypothetical protein [Chloroflexota bacterium]MCI0643900.1 hypothetical protein [Chloroflexota bacterium]MCI0729190.1 hypothetical protein [Chloroflexota bacterium]